MVSNSVEMAESLKMDRRGGLESENDIGANKAAVRVRWEVPHQSPMYVLELTLTWVLLADKD